MQFLKLTQAPHDTTCLIRVDAIVGVSVDGNRSVIKTNDDSVPWYVLEPIDLVARLLQQAWLDANRRLPGFLTPAIVTLDEDAGPKPAL